MRKLRLLFVVIGIALLSFPPATLAQSQAAPLKNQTVVAMVKGGLPESVVLGTIRSSATQFDVSPAALAGLKQNGVTQKVIDAMVSAEGRKQAVATASARASSTGAGPAPAAAVLPPQPYVLFVQDGAKSPLTTAQAQVASVKSNRKELGALAADGALATALQATVQGTVSRSASDLGASAASSLAGFSRDARPP
jgi:type II secretory pathway component PulM